MESLVHLDTNVIVWLYTGYIEQLSIKAKKIIEKDYTLTISPMVILELAYLNEIGRLRVTSHVVISDLHDRIGLTIDTTPFPLIIDSASQMQWTRDPFDRIITAQAAVYQNILLTKDDTIRTHYSKALW